MRCGSRSTVTIFGSELFGFLSVFIIPLSTPRIRSPESKARDLCTIVARTNVCIEANAQWLTTQERAPPH